MNKKIFSHEKIRHLIKSKQGFISVFPLLLLAIISTVLADLTLLFKADQANLDFLRQKSLTYNQMLSAANETRWEMYHYYATGEGSPDIQKASQGKDLIQFNKIYKTFPQGNVKRQFYAAKTKDGGYWLFSAQDPNILPSLKWYFKVANNKIIESRWGP